MKIEKWSEVPWVFVVQLLGGSVGIYAGIVIVHDLYQLLNEQPTWWLK